jgi:hypothetical protein
MAENRTDLSKGSERTVEPDAHPETADIGAKRQSGRPPARPPYEQYLRVSKIAK